MSKVALVSTGPKKKCIMSGCQGWEFQSGLCRNHVAAKPELAAAIEHYREREPMQVGLLVTQAVASPHYIGLAEGDKVDILDILSDNQSVIIRRADGGIGYFNINFLATEEEVYAQFAAQQQHQAEEAERAAIEAAKQAEIEFDRKIRQNMLAMAEMEKVKRVEDAERRKREAEMRLQAEMERRQREEELRRQAEAQMQAARAEAERLRAEEAARRMEEARINKMQWDQDEKRRAEAKLQALPKWQQDLVANKRRQQGEG